MTKIKICGLTDLTDAQIVNEVQPDYVGFVFASGRHHIDFNQAKRLRASINHLIPAVGVFINPKLTDVLSLYNEKIIQLVQLHGSESEEFVNELKKLNIPVIKVFKPEKETVNETEADLILLDSGNGSGMKLDWQNLPHVDKRKLIIAGGITPTNVKKVIQEVGPQIVDCSSGVEVNGKKDYQLVKEIVEIAHAN